MANVRSGNSIYVDSTGSVASDVNIKLIGIFFTSATAGDTITLKDGTNAGALKLTLKNIDVSTHYFRLPDAPIIFANGIYVSQISSGAVATLVTRPQGSNS